ncbi:NHLP leader peptide domain-containing protein [Desulfotomaculum arcticum]|uniref:NHLP leader peptide domain-containing protein n=1 Tax=Desulfotruncus arcticus DSM 17038 TaxID=1121424 RepID=A0A1I2XEY6_9FIRM|nr:NHLP leader peptide family RiPP precursor [Desulfotruncus arcticus]SFH11982.1 NHLP leader peptide domain-containing protein [Desulfotomaculum arcticum] [Desulfotruncus arcticus DSM 17038]
METNSNNLTRREIEEQIINKAGADEEFKKELMSDPHKAIAQFGVEIPKEIDIKVVEETPKLAYLVLPMNQEVLADGALDMVAGGCSCTMGQIAIEPPLR